MKVQLWTFRQTGYDRNREDPYNRNVLFIHRIQIITDGQVPFSQNNRNHADQNLFAVYQERYKTNENDGTCNTVWTTLPTAHGDIELKSGLSVSF